MTLSARRSVPGAAASEPQGPRTEPPLAADDFPSTAPAAHPVFYRTYSRKTASGRESWQEASERSLAGLQRLGQLGDSEVDLIRRMQQQQKALPSGRWLWIGGTAWIENPENFSGAYNCTSTNLVDWDAFALMMDLAMMGCGTGAILEPRLISRLPVVRNRLNVEVVRDIGVTPAAQRRQDSTHQIEGQQVFLQVGDTRRGWVQSYRLLLELCSDERFAGTVQVVVDLGDVRPVGEKLAGFGGVANPVKLRDLYGRVAQILNRAQGRQLSSVECCLLIDEAAVTIVAGNIRRSAGMRQFAAEDQEAAAAKANLWQQDGQGNWRIDPERDALRMANHTRVFHDRPSLEVVREAVQRQFESGEGAIQFAPEAIARSNADLLTTPELREAFIGIYCEQGRHQAGQWLLQRQPQLSAAELEHRLGRYGLNPCVSADTWVLTGEGPRQVRELIGRQHSTYVNGELFSTTPAGFFASGVKPVFRLRTREGQELRLTGNHKVLKVSAQTQRAQYTEWVEAQTLQPGDRVKLHDHRDARPWDGAGSEQEGWLLGHLVGGGSLAATACSDTAWSDTAWSDTAWSDTAQLRHWGEVREATVEPAVGLLEPAVGYRRHTAEVCLHEQLQHRLPSASGLAKLAAHYGIRPGSRRLGEAIERTSHAFHRGFLRGLFDADGSVPGQQAEGVSVRLTQSDLDTLKAAQRMLGRLGILSTICQNRSPEGERQLPDSNRELAGHRCQAQHELVIANDNLQVFAQHVGFSDSQTQQRLEQLLVSCRHTPSRERFTATVEAVEADGVEAVYDCTVPGPARFDANGLVAHNCGEIIGADFHCVAGSTLMITRDGLHPIRSLVGQTVEVWNGRRWSQVVPVQTGHNRPMYRVSFGDGTWLDVTGKHRFFVGDGFSSTYTELTTEELSDRLDSHPYALHTEPFQIDYRDGEFVDPTWAYSLGQLVGDGFLCQSNGKPRLQLRFHAANSHQNLALAGRSSGELRHDADHPEPPRLLYTGFHDSCDPEQVRALKEDAQALDALAGWNREGILHFIAGLIDADGSEAASSGGVRLCISDYDRAYRLHLLLLKCGIRSSIDLIAKIRPNPNPEARQQDHWYLQIADCAAIPCQRLHGSSGHEPKARGPWQLICSVEPLPGQHDSFCFNEPEFHKGVFGGTLTGQCNLAEVHLNRIDPHDPQDQEDAFRAAALSVACLLNHRFEVERYRQSRAWDPIVGVSFTGLFDFCVHAFGTPWLQWWEAGRPDSEEGRAFRDREAHYLSRWRQIVQEAVWDYCDRHGLRRPNRCTTVQPAGTKSLLTGASPGWHPPKAQRFIRRITFRKNDPVALACLDYGYTIVPSQSDKDEQGRLLDDPFDPRCSEWLVEIPTEVSWANLPGADGVEINRFSALAQFDFYMQVQRHYTTHNTSATVELREHEIEPLAGAIHHAIHNGDGYISAALLARFDANATFPRLPFEPIDQITYQQRRAEVEARRRSQDFFEALRRYDSGELIEAGPAGCDSDKCLLPLAAPDSSAG